MVSLRFKYLIILILLGYFSVFDIFANDDYTSLIHHKDGRTIAIKSSDIDSITFTNQAVQDSLFLLDEENMNSYIETVCYDSLFCLDGFINSTGTIVHSNEGWKHTDYIDITDAVMIYANACMNNTYGGGISFYDQYNNFTEVSHTLRSS